MCSEIGKFKTEAEELGLTDKGEILRYVRERQKESAECLFRTQEMNKKLDVEAKMEAKKLEKEKEENLKKLEQEERENLRKLEKEKEENLKKLEQEERENLRKLEKEKEENLKKLEQEERENLRKLEKEEKENLRKLEKEKEENLMKLKKVKEENLRKLEKEKEENLRRLEMEKEERVKAHELEMRRFELEKSDRDAVQKEAIIAENNKKEIELAKLAINERVDLQTLDMRGRELSMQNEVQIRTIESQENLARTGKSEHEVREVNRSRLDLPNLTSTDKDEVDIYFSKFQKLMILWNIPKEKWNSMLVPRLPTCMSSIFDRLPEDSIGDYDMLYEEIQSKFLLTGQHYRSKFRAVSQLIGETASEYISRISEILKRWIKVEKVEEDFQGICEFLVKDQILFKWEQVDPNKALFIRERDPKNLPEIADVADLYDKSRIERKKGSNMNSSNNYGQGSHQNR